MRTSVSTDCIYFCRFIFTIYILRDGFSFLLSTASMVILDPLPVRR